MFAFDGFVVHTDSGPAIGKGAPTINPGGAVSRYVGNGSQQGDGGFPTSHASQQIADSRLDGVDDFSPTGDANDSIMQIATGAAGRMNPAADPALSQQPGPIGESDPGRGVQFPVPMPGMFEPGTSPGPQGGGRAEPAIGQSFQGPKGAGPVMQKDVHDFYMPNGLQEAVYGAPQYAPHSFPSVVYMGIGCQDIGGGAAASLCGTIEPQDQQLSPVESVPVPPARPAYDVTQDVTPISATSGNLHMDDVTSPNGPTMYSVTRAGEETN